MLCGSLRPRLPSAVAAFRFGSGSVVPWMFVKGTVRAKVGGFLARTWVAASKPDAIRIRDGSLKAVPKKLIPSGIPEAAAYLARRTATPGS